MSSVVSAVDLLCGNAASPGPMAYPVSPMHQAPQLQHSQPLMWNPPVAAPAPAMQHPTSYSAVPWPAPGSPALQPVTLQDPVAQLRQNAIQTGTPPTQLPPWCQDATRDLMYPSLPPTPMNAAVNPVQAWALESRFKAQQAAEIQQKWAEDMQRSFLEGYLASGVPMPGMEAAAAAAKAAETAAKCDRDAQALKQLLGVTPEKRRARANGAGSPRKPSGKPGSPAAADAKTPDAKAKQMRVPPGLAELNTPQKASVAKPRRRGGRRSGTGSADKENMGI